MNSLEFCISTSAYVRPNNITNASATKIENPNPIITLEWFYLGRAQTASALSSSLGNRYSWQIGTVAGSYLGYILYIESIDILIPMFIGEFL